jgi:hypothetical protein
MRDSAIGVHREGIRQITHPEDSSLSNVTANKAPEGLPPATESASRRNTTVRHFISQQYVTSPSSH